MLYSKFYDFPKECPLTFLQENCFMNMCPREGGGLQMSTFVYKERLKVVKILPLSPPCLSKQFMDVPFICKMHISRRVYRIALSYKVHSFQEHTYLKNRLTHFFENIALLFQAKISGSFCKKSWVRRFFKYVLKKNGL